MVKVIGYLIVAVTVQGCGPVVQVGPKNLDFDEPAIVSTCTKANVPPPLAETVTIRIAPNKEVLANSGGAKLLREYAALRKAIREGRLMQCSK